MIIYHLLNHLKCFAFVEQHTNEYSPAIILSFIKKKIQELKDKHQIQQVLAANAPLNLTEPKEINLCFYMIRNLIRCNDLSLEEDLVFLL